MTTTTINVTNAIAAGTYQSQNISVQTQAFTGTDSSFTLNLTTVSTAPDPADGPLDATIIVINDIPAGTWTTTNLSLTDAPDTGSGADSTLTLNFAQPAPSGLTAALGVQVINGQTFLYTNNSTGAVKYAIFVSQPGNGYNAEFGPNPNIPSSTWQVQSGATSVYITAWDANGNYVSSAPQNFTLSQQLYTMPSADFHGQTVTLTGSLADGTVLNVSATPGQIVPVVPAKPLLGVLRYFADGLCCVISNDQTGTTADLVGTFTISVGGTTLWSGPLTIYVSSATRPFWLLPTVPLKTSPDLSCFPTIGPGSTAATTYPAYIASDQGVMGIGHDVPGMGTAGSTPHLGPLAGWDMCWLANPSADNLQAVRGQADASAPWPFHWWDVSKQKVLRPLDYSQCADISSAWGKGDNPIMPYTTVCPYIKGSMSASHAPAFNALACALWGTDFDIWSLQNWNYWVNCCGGGWTGRSPAGSTIWAPGGAQRGIARGLKVAIYASILAPDPAGDFVAWINEGSTLFAPRYYNGQTGLQIAQNARGSYAGSQFAPWQQKWLVYSTGLAIQCGYTAYQTLFDYWSEWIFDICQPDSSSGSPNYVQHEFCMTPHVEILRSQTSAEATAISAAATSTSNYADTLTRPTISTASGVIAALTTYIQASAQGFALQTQNCLLAVLSVSVSAAFKGGWNAATFATTFAANTQAQGVPSNNWLQALQTTANLDPSFLLGQSMAQAESSAALMTAWGYTPVDPTKTTITDYWPGDLVSSPWSPELYAAEANPCMAYVSKYATNQTAAQATYSKWMQYLRVDFSVDATWNVAPPA